MHMCMLTKIFIILSAIQFFSSPIFVAVIEKIQLSFGESPSIGSGILTMALNMMRREIEKIKKPSSESRERLKN
jgi:hypothetical protein